MTDATPDTLSDPASTPSTDDGRPADRNIHLPYHQRSQVHHRVVAELAARYTPEGKVVDVGCGLGYTLRELQRRSPRLDLYGADQDATCLERTGELVDDFRPIRMGEEGFDVEGLGSGYDACILSHVLEHLPHPSEAVHRLLGILRPGGHLILAVPNPVRPSVILTSLLRRRAVNPGHLQAWDRSHWMNFLERWIDAEVVAYASDEVRLVPRSWKEAIPPFEAAQRGLARLLPWWSFSNIAVLRRSAAE